MNGLHVRPSPGAPFPPILSPKSGLKTRSEKGTLQSHASDEIWGGVPIDGDPDGHPDGDGVWRMEQSLEHANVLRTVADYLREFV